jgi:hypothetical protein
MVRPLPLSVLSITALLLSGCSFTSTIEIAAPGGHAPASPGIASMRMYGSEIFGVSEDALTSRAALVKLDDETTCIDMVLRHPAGPPLRSTNLSLEVDEVHALTFEAVFDECKAGRACLPIDSPVTSFTTESDERVGVEAGRMCFEKLPRARRELSIGRPGLFAWRFRFVLHGPEPRDG